jgi:hypothetical protein
VTADLVRHSVAEEMYMYPAARRSLPDGDQVADHEIAEHAEIEHTLKDLEGLDATDPQFEQLVSKVIADIRHHVQDEEQQLLAGLQGAMSCSNWAGWWSAPRRPHQQDRIPRRRTHHQPTRS